jgi:hypothetical protein
MTSTFAIGLTGGGRHTTPMLALGSTLLGLCILLKGIRNDTIDSSGMEKAPRWMYFAGGIILQLPAIFYAYYLRIHA